MPPETGETSKVAERRYCGLGNHLLKTPNTTIKDSNMRHFALNINPELRRDTPLCMDCYKTLGKIYRFKLKHAIQHRQKQQAESISDVSSSQRQDLLTSSSEVTSMTSSTIINRLATATATAAKPPTPVPVRTPSPSSDSDDNMPTTSAAAAGKRKRSHPMPEAQPVAQASHRYSVSDDDDANSDLSLNAVNGTRLPHIQPIPKRRQVVHLNKTAMDIYLAGTTGG
ncbi:GL24882 [Drosophila persimilis]|uniref:GL24882 n=1 Tax=Drosophila persimilis TaxID=7234 RepID=B4GRS1_DROPE|nr:uncharacterized protein LOC6595823 [Drosophila persimilis]EDW40456.1 GL24882 [Drosophila persimilis]